MRQILRNPLRITLMLIVLSLALISTSQAVTPKGQHALGDTGFIAAIMAGADWVRVDLDDEHAPVQGFIDAKTYEALPHSQARFWHRLSTSNGTSFVHLYVDCGNQRYKKLASFVFDSRGRTVDEEVHETEWKQYTPGSNVDTLCLTLSPTGSGIIHEEDLPIIRNLLLNAARRASRF